jgi:hypothetical protein
MTTSTSNPYVVYAFSRSGKDRFGNHGTYYYIGKGKPDRPYTCSNRKTVKCPKDRKNNIHILYKDLDEKSAFEIEIKLIAKYGRIDLYPESGILRNRTDGGEGVSGAKISEEARRNISGKNSYRYRPRCWSHPTHGFIFKKSISDIMEMYSCENLLQSGLSGLAMGRSYSYKDWVFIPEYLIDSSKSLGELKSIFGKSYASERLERIRFNRSGKNNNKYISRNWSHPVYGLEVSMSSSELIKKYPQDNMTSSGLSSVVSGKSDHHRNWIYIDNSLINRNFSKEKLEELFGKKFATRKLKEMKDARKSKRRKPKRCNVSTLPRDWYHPDVGIVTNTPVSELVRKYSGDVKLNPSLLYAVASGKRNHHRGWTLYKVSS